MMNAIDMKRFRLSQTISWSKTNFTMAFPPRYNDQMWQRAHFLGLVMNNDYRVIYIYIEVYKPAIEM